MKIFCFLKMFKLVLITIMINYGIGSLLNINYFFQYWNNEIKARETQVFYLNNLTPKYKLKQFFIYVYI